MFVVGIVVVHGPANFDCRVCQFLHILQRYTDTRRQNAYSWRTSMAISTMSPAASAEQAAVNGAAQ